jgi:hypothetical protein
MKERRTNSVTMSSFSFKTSSGSLLLVSALGYACACVKKLTSFSLGGWAMQDEACSTYSADIDQVCPGKIIITVIMLHNTSAQMTEGHQFLLDTFGVTPRLGWQIDPFGASSVTPTLFSMMGFDGHVIQRINYQTKVRI